MSNSTWTLEKELCKLAKSAIMQEALYKLGLVKEPDIKFAIHSDDNWVRGGAETYTYRFWIKDENGIESGYIIKACAAFSPVITLNNILEEWVKRRKILVNEGVSTPFLFYYGEGVIIEELIPFSLKDVLKNPVIQQINILKDLARLAGILSKLGFAPINAFSDLFSRGNDVVIVDFGEDIGPPNLFIKPRKELFDHLVNQLSEYGLNLEEELIDILYAEFIANGGDYQH